MTKNVAAIRDPAFVRLFRSVGAFLDEHRLEPTPANYLLAYRLVTRTNPAAVAAVEQVTSDGVRLTQRDADQILLETGLGLGDGGAAPSAEAAREVAEQARRQLETLQAIVGDTQAQAAAYGRDLATSAAQLSAVPPDQNPVEELLRITGEMIDRTKDAERQLQRTNEEVQSLRRELANASAEARTDVLTGLPNRRALEDTFAHMRESGMTFSVAVCDIDRFKSINDKHGHAVGDRVLKAVARSLESSCPGHLVSRYGGEEFVILLGGLDAQHAAVVMDAARGELASRRFVVKETEHNLGAITISVGVAESLPGESWMELLMRADALLYRAKQDGRNRVEVEPRSAVACAG
jgi:diguanylate cyclase